MSRRKPPVTTKAQREAMAEDWVKLREKIGDRMREAHEAHMFAFGTLLNMELLFGQPPKPPTSVETQQDGISAVAATLRAEVEKNVLAAFKLQADAISGLLKLEALFGQPPMQTVPPPAPAWRSMASAPRDGTPVLLVMKHGGIHVADFEQSSGKWYFGGGVTLPDSDFVAWHRIPKWSGGVSE